MNQIPRQKLLELVARFGPSLSEDARRCEALLRDVCGDQYRREVFVLVGAVKDGVASQLAGSRDGAPKAVVLNRLSKRLHDNLGLAEDLAKWSVDSWALAFGVVKLEDITLQFRCPKCGFTARIITQLAGRRIRCPKCKVALRVSADGRTFSTETTAPRGQEIPLAPIERKPVTSDSSYQPPASADDPFADEPSVTAEEMLRQAIRRILADGVVTELERSEAQSLRRTLGISTEVARRIFTEEKDRLSSRSNWRHPGHLLKQLLQTFQPDALVAVNTLSFVILMILAAWLLPFRGQLVIAIIAAAGIGIISMTLREKQHEYLGLVMMVVLFAGWLLVRGAAAAIAGLFRLIL